MLGYIPEPGLTKAVLDGITGSLPFLVRTPLRLVPRTAKELVISTSLAQVVPLSLMTIASTQVAGSKVSLTSHGVLTEEVKKGMIRRIAEWLVPEEVQDITSQLNKEVIRLAKAEFGNGSWQLKVEENEVVLHVYSTSIVRESYTTVADALFDSFESLKALKDKVFQRFTRTGV